MGRLLGLRGPRSSTCTSGSSRSRSRPRPDGDVSRFDRTKMMMTAVTYDEHAPGLLGPSTARIKDFELNWVDGSLPFPTFPRFCGQTFYEGDDKELGLACVQAYNDWMVEEWCAPSGGMNIPLCIMPLWDAELAGRGDPAQRGARRPRGLLQRDPDAPRAAEHPHRRLGPRASRRATTPASRCACTSARRRPCPSRRPTHRPASAGRLAFNNSMASTRGLAVLRQAHRVPEAEARLLRGPDRLDPVRARAGRHGVGAARRVDAQQGAHPRAAVAPTTTGASSAASPRTTTASPSSTRSAWTTSASRPTTRTPTRRGRTRQRVRREDAGGLRRRRRSTRCCAATRSAWIWQLDRRLWRPHRPPVCSRPGRSAKWQSRGTSCR